MQARGYVDLDGCALAGSADRRGYRTHRTFVLVMIIAAVPNTGGASLTFDDFHEGGEAFGTRIQPLTASRR